MPEDSVIHRWNPRHKFVTLALLIVAFSLVQDVPLIPLMLLVTGSLFLLSGLSVRYLIRRLRYPGVFLLVLMIYLPLFAGETVLFQVGAISVYVEGTTYMLLVVSRFTAILTVTVILFSTSPLLTNIHTLKSFGLSPVLADMLLLTVRYLFEISDRFNRMQTAMRLRGFRFTRLNQQQMGQLAGLIGSLLVQSYEQAQRVYHAMRLRGYGTMREEAIMQPSAPALGVRDLTFRYGNLPVLDGISFSVSAGERVGVIGCNGAGKTSLFLTICGVNKAHAGDVTVYGQRIAPGKFHPQVGLVFQHSDDQLFSPTVQEDVAFGLVNMGLAADEVNTRVQEALELTATTHLAERPPHHLSGGEKRMVAIAGVLAMHPAVVLYDEPDTSLDHRARRRLIQFLKDAPHTLMIASHDLEMILAICPRVIVLDQGRIVADGNAAEVMSDAAFMESIGLDIPYSLIRDMPHV